MRLGEILWEADELGINLCATMDGKWHTPTGLEFKAVRGISSSGAGGERNFIPLKWRYIRLIGWMYVRQGQLFGKLVKDLRRYCSDEEQARFDAFSTKVRAKLPEHIWYSVGERAREFTLHCYYHFDDVRGCVRHLTNLDDRFLQYKWREMDEQRGAELVDSMHRFEEKEKRWRIIRDDEWYVEEDEEDEEDWEEEYDG